jgi:transcriptional regulator with XRE-family HTH domain
MSLEKLVIDNIKRIRKAKGISQEKLAEACSTATSYIGLMEIYRNVPKLSTIERIAAALEVDPLTLFQRTDEQSADGNVAKKIAERAEAKLQKVKKTIVMAIEADIEKALRAYL